MHVMVRRYKMAGSMDRLMETVERQYAEQLSKANTSHAAPVRVPPGILSYQAVRTGEDTLLTITVFESAELLEQAQQGAGDIRRSLSDFHVEEIETFSGEVAISRISDKLVQMA
jgi:hypothetical protein